MITIKRGVKDYEKIVSRVTADTIWVHLIVLGNNVMLTPLEFGHWRKFLMEVA